MKGSAYIGVVIIGRNEGDRLVRCLASVASQARHVVYVDSGSDDDSVQQAMSAGAEVVELDTKYKFTAARARNAGLEKLKSAKGIEYVQFVDGDCELQPGWIDTAQAFLTNKKQAAAAFGNLREKFPELSVYNRLCDWEWKTPIGQARSCGGIVMMRMSAIVQVGGFNSALIAGEEPELCVRLRAQGWEIWSLDDTMAYHDVAITRFGQWWKRARRGGHAYAQGAALHGAPPERHNIGEVRRALAWGLCLPISILLLSFLSTWALALFLLYPLQVIRLAMRDDFMLRGAWERAFFLTLIKFPESVGIIQYYWDRIFGQGTKIIEYK